MPAGLPLDPAVAELREPARERAVHVGAVLRAEAGGLPHHDRGAPLADPALGQRAQGVRHLPHQRGGQAEVPAALDGGVVAGERDLGGDAAALLLRGDTLRRLLGPLGGVERHRDPGLRGGRGALETLERGEQVDPLVVVGRGVGAREPVQEGLHVGGGGHRLRGHGCPPRRTQSNVCSIISEIAMAGQGSRPPAVDGIPAAGCRLGWVQWFHCLTTQEGLIGFDLGR